MTLFKPKMAANNKPLLLEKKDNYILLQYSEGKRILTYGLLMNPDLVTKNRIIVSKEKTHNSTHETEHPFTN